MAETHRLANSRKILVKELNDYLTCSLCSGYLIDATAVVDCSHTFCRACIVRHFESSRFCPNCGSLVHKSKPLSKLRSDTTLQSLIYKVVPSLYSKELQRRADFYHSTGFRANSSCSDDSVLGDRTLDNEEWVLSNIGDASLFFSPDDSISLSVEYYHADSEKTAKSAVKTENDSSVNDSCGSNGSVPVIDLKTDTATLAEPQKTDSGAAECKNESGVLGSKVCDDSAIVAKDSSVENNHSGDASLDPENQLDDIVHKRFLRCPAAVRMSHLMKFLRMKYALSNEHRVDIIYDDEVLPPYLSLMDVAYTFKWNRENPMRFFYLIYVPTIRPVVPQQPTPTIIAPLAPPVPPVKVEALVKPEPPVVPTPASDNIKPVKELKIKEPVKELKIKEPVKDLKIKEPVKELKIKEPVKELKIKEPVKSEIEDKKEDNNNVKFPQKSVKFLDEKPPIPEPKSQKSVKFVDSVSKSSDYNSVQKSHNFDYKIKNERSSEESSTAENCIYDYTEPDKDEIKAFAERRDREWALQKHADAVEVHVSKKRKKNKHSKNEFMHKKRKLHAEITSNEVLSKSDDSLKLKVKLSVANGHKHKHRSNSSSGSSSISLSTSEPVKTQELSPKERLLQMRQVRHKNITPPAVEDKPKNVESKLDPAEKMDLGHESPPKITEKAPDILTSGKTLRSDFSYKTSMSKDICKLVRVNLEKCPDGKNGGQKKNSVASITIKKEDKSELSVDKARIGSKTEIIPIENKVGETKGSGSGSKVLEIKDEGSKPVMGKALISKSTEKGSNGKLLENILSANGKLAESKAEDKKTVSNITITETNRENKINIKLQDKVQKPPEVKMAPKPNEPKPIDESKTIENKLNSIDFKSSQSGTLVTKNFTVSKVESGAKRKLETQDSAADKRPSLEITVINLVSRPQPTSTVQTKPVTSTQTKPAVSISSEPPPAKKIRPPPLTIPLGRIQKMNLKPPEKCDIFGALDLSAKPNKPEVKSSEYRSHSASPSSKIQDQIQNIIRPKTPIKHAADHKMDTRKSGPEKLQFPDKRPNITNLQMLSESAVQIREMMVKGSMLPIPNLIKKTPTSLSQNSGLKSPNFLQKSPNFQAKTPMSSKLPAQAPKPGNQIQKPPNQITKPPGAISKSPNPLPKPPNPLPKPPNSMPKPPNPGPPKGLAFQTKSPNLQKLPKLNEISKGQFCRLNSAQQLRNSRPTSQNQSIRNIPNPSLLVRQQNQNRINSLNSASSSISESKEVPSAKPGTAKPNSAAENAEADKKTESKASEPPPLKPIESYKK